MKAFPSYTNSKMYFLYPRISIEFMQNMYVEIQNEESIKLNWFTCLFITLN